MGTGLKAGVNERLRSTIVKPPRLQNTRHFMRVSDFIARTVTQRRTLVWCGVAILIAICVGILGTSLRLDSEIFNVLPGRFSSVQGLKIYDHDFEQTRELMVEPRRRNERMVLVRHHGVPYPGEEICDGVADYHDDLVIPGIIPSWAISRRQMRQRPNFR